MSGVPETDTAHLPAAHDLAQDSGTVEKRFPGANGKFIDQIGGDIVADIENAWAFVAGQAIDVFRPI
jgi:hypothetical protein